MTLMRFLARLYFTLKFLWLLLRSGWTSPNTAVAGAPISASDYNTYVRDNLAYLFSQRPKSWNIRDNGATYTTSSASFTNVGADLSKSVTINSGRVMVSFSCVLLGDGTPGGYKAAFDVTVDGTRIGAAFADGLAGALINAASGGLIGTVSWVGFVEGLSVGAHTFALQYKTNTGTLQLASGNGTSGADFAVTFNVLEV